MDVYKKLRADPSNEGDTSLWNDDGSVDTNSQAWLDVYLPARENTPERRSKGNDNIWNQSAGPFKIKNNPQSFIDKYGISKEGLYGSDVPEDLELERGSNASLMHMVESYYNSSIVDIPDDNIEEEEMVAMRKKGGLLYQE